jgi:diguanylate cyclase (GGDEF)-like protein
MGDLVLKKVAGILSGALRKADVLARFGGEEFVILLPNVTARGALESAERLRESVALAAIHPGGPRKRVTVSIGAAFFPTDASDSESLLKAADEALYEAKHLGRNRVVAKRA